MPYLGKVQPTETTATITEDFHSGDGATVAFTLSATPPDEQSIFAYLDGILQHSDAYSFSGTTLTFSVAPPSGTNNVMTRIIVDTGVQFVPSDNSVSPSKTTGMQNVIQIQYMQDGAVATGTTTIPVDDTIPQITEGIEFMTLNITPTDASNILVIRARALLNHTAGRDLTIVLFQNGVSDGLSCQEDRAQDPTLCYPVELEHVMVAGTTSTITFSIRCGTTTAGTMTFNGSAGVGRYGGILNSGITITEYKP